MPPADSGHGFSHGFRGEEAAIAMRSPETKPIRPGPRPSSSCLVVHLGYQGSAMGFRFLVMSFVGGVPLFCVCAFQHYRLRGDLTGIMFVCFTLLLWAFACVAGARKLMARPFTQNVVVCHSEGVCLLEEARLLSSRTRQFALAQIAVSVHQSASNRGSASFYYVSLIAGETKAMVGRFTDLAQAESMARTIQQLCVGRDRGLLES